MKLAVRIRKIREAQDKTQLEIADAIGITPSAYGQMERAAGSSSFDTLCKLAAALQVSMLFLVDIESELFIEKTS